MKNRLLSLLLTVCMVVMLFTGLAVTASAADTIKGYLVSYTFQAGDTMYGVCDAKGIDANTQLNTIARINNITNYNYMLPGKVLWLPSSTATTASPYYSLLSHTLAPGETPASLCQSYGVDYNGSYNLLAALNNNLTVFMAGQQFILPLYIDPTNAAATTTVTPATTTAATTAVTPVAGTAAVPTGDTLSYYLAQHTLLAGETVSGVCAALGVDFGKEDARIRSINNINNYNTMLPGKVLLLPVAAKPNSGSYYQVVSHKVAQGDTVFGLCTQYGLNFSAYLDLIQKLNPKLNLNTLYPGNTLYMPQYVAAATTGGVITGGTAAGAAAGTAGGAGYVPPVVTPIPVATPTPDGYVAPGAAAGTTAVVVPGTGTVIPAAGTTVPANIPAADTLSYLVIPHSLAAGETVSGICAALGVDFMQNYDRIMQLSNIADYNYLLPGKLILIPSTVYPPSGPYYKIMAHTLVAGDTVYGLCAQYGLDYTSNAAFLQRLNNRNDLSTYYVGQTLYLPLYVAG